MVRMAHLLTFVALWAVVSAGAAAQSQPAPDALARSLQQRYRGIKDFSADFVQTYEGGVLRTKTTERGTMSIGPAFALRPYAIMTRPTSSCTK